MNARILPLPLILSGDPRHECMLLILAGEWNAGGQRGLASPIDGCSPGKKRFSTALGCPHFFVLSNKNAPRIQAAPPPCRQASARYRAWPRTQSCFASLRVAHHPASVASRLGAAHDSPAGQRAAGRDCTTTAVGAIGGIETASFST